VHTEELPGVNIVWSMSMEKARLTRQLDVRDCARRNALTNKPANFELAAGSIGIVVDTLGNGDAYLVEFGSRGPDKCDWLGVLYASEIELMPAVAKAA
jgi:hypothetical protein